MNIVIEIMQDYLLVTLITADPAPRAMALGGEGSPEKCPLAAVLFPSSVEIVAPEPKDTLYWLM